MCRRDYLPNGKAKNFKVGVRMEDVVDPHQRQAHWPPRLPVYRSRSHGMSDPWGHTTKFARYSDKAARRIWPTIAVTSKVKGQSHKLTSSVLCTSRSPPLLNSGNKCCSCVIRSSIACWSNTAAAGHTLLFHMSSVPSQREHGVFYVCCPGW